MEADTQLYRSRFLMLFLFVMYSMSNAFQWIEYAIITNIVSEYYNVEEFAINWTSMIYMASYIPLIFPANWILEKKGLRFAVLLGSFGTCLGKCSSSSFSSFVWCSFSLIRSSIFKCVMYLDKTYSRRAFIRATPSRVLRISFCCYLYQCSNSQIVIGGKDKQMFFYLPLRSIYFC